MDVLGLDWWDDLADLGKDFGRVFVSENKKVVKGGGKVIGEVAMVARDTGNILIQTLYKNDIAIATLGNYGEFGTVKIEEITTYSNFYESVRDRIATDTYFFETALNDGSNAVIASNPITGTYVATQTMTEAAMEGDSEKFGGGAMSLALVASTAIPVKGPVFTKANWFEAPTLFPSSVPKPSTPQVTMADQYSLNKAPVSSSEWYTQFSNKYGMENVSWTKLEVPSPKTTGVLSTTAGEFHLTSGYCGPTANVGKVAGMNIILKAHVEAHAAAVLRQLKLETGTLILTKEPCLYKTGKLGLETGCETKLPVMLGKDKSLRVIVPSKVDKVYIGK